MINSEVLTLVSRKPRESNTVISFVRNNPDSLPQLLEHMCTMLNVLEESRNIDSERIFNLESSIKELRVTTRKMKSTPTNIADFLCENQEYLENFSWDGSVVCKNGVKIENQEDLIEFELKLRGHHLFINSEFFYSSLLEGIKKAFLILKVKDKISKEDELSQLRFIADQFFANSKTKPRKNIASTYLSSHSNLDPFKVKLLAKELGYREKYISRKLYFTKH